MYTSKVQAAKHSKLVTSMISVDSLLVHHATFQSLSIYNSRDNNTIMILIQILMNVNQAMEAVMTCVQTMKEVSPVCVARGMNLNLEMTVTPQMQGSYVEVHN